MVFFDLGRKTQDYETRNARPLGARTYVDRSMACRPYGTSQKRSRSLTLRYTILPKMLRILIIGASKNGSKVGIFCETQAENAENFTHPQQLMIKEVIKSQNVGIPQVGERLLFCIQIFVIL